MMHGHTNIKFNNMHLYKRQSYGETGTCLLFRSQGTRICSSVFASSNSQQSILSNRRIQLRRGKFLYYYVNKGPIFCSVLSPDHVINYNILQNCYFRILGKSVLTGTANFANSQVPHYTVLSNLAFTPYLLQIPILY